MNPYHQLVQAYVRHAHEGAGLPLGGFPNCPRPAIALDAPKALIFSPHPDDEVIIGGWALRLMRESGWRVVNVAVTQGSKKERQAERLAELTACCQCIGFDLETTIPGGLERINLTTRQHDNGHWGLCVKVIADILRKHTPRAIFFPHELDWNSSHVGTNFLVLDALKQLGSAFTCHTVETEFWGQMPHPNVMVEINPGDLGDLITALTFHVGEVKRNPYHLSMPAWMIDSVRRGGELVGGQGGAVPDFRFATLYRLRKWQDGRLQQVLQQGVNLAAGDSPDRLLV